MKKTPLIQQQHIQKTLAGLRAIHRSGVSAPSAWLNVSTEGGVVESLGGIPVLEIGAVVDAGSIDVGIVGGVWFLPLWRDASTKGHATSAYLRAYEDADAE